MTGLPQPRPASGRRRWALGPRTARHLAGLLVAASLGAAELAHVAAQDNGRATTLRFGFSPSLVEDANLPDALAAMVYWVRAVGVAAGGWQNAEARVIDDPAAVTSWIDANDVDLFALSTIEYLAAERGLRADPCMAYEAHDEVEVEYVLVARTGTRSIRELQGKRLSYFNASGHRGIADAWLDVTLLEAGLSERDRAFAEARPAKKASQAILPVFFNQADAALVSGSAFETAVEMNPQLGRGLAVVARSPRLLPGLICANRSLAPDRRRRWIESATTIHKTPQFRQTFMVLRMNRLVPWNPRYLDNARAVLARYQALKRRTTGR